MNDMLARIFLRQRLITTKCVRVITLIIVILLVFHAAVILGPLIATLCGKGALEEWELEHLRFASKSLALVTLTLVMALGLCFIQSRLLDIGRLQREKLYEIIKKQIFEWFAESDTPLGESEAELLRQDVIIQSQLQHLKIKGNVQGIIKRWPELKVNRLAIEEYCSKVHFEITSYPSELMYGLHFELDSLELNKKLCTFAVDVLGIKRQYSCLTIDTSVPKKPHWIFLTVKFEMEGEFQTEAPRMVTHGRHFVEFVGHNYEVVYGKQMIDKYIKEKQKTDT